MKETVAADYWPVGSAMSNGLARHSVHRQPSEATPQMPNITREASSFGDGRPPAQIQPAIATATIAHKKNEKIDLIKFISMTCWDFKGITELRVKLNAFEN